MIHRHYDIATGEITDREMTAEEIAEVQQRLETENAEIAAKEAAEAKRQAVLAALAAAAGLEMDEVKAALGA